MAITVEDVKNSLLNRRYGEDFSGIIFRPTTGNGFIELDFPLVMKAFEEIVAKIPIVEANIDDFTATEKVLFQLFVAHAKWDYS